jgi:transcription elongation factor Elf1
MSELDDRTTPSVESSDRIESAGVQITERDVVFECPHCQGELVADKEGAGLTVNCSLCGQPVTVPEYHGPSLQFLQAVTEKLSEALQATRKGIQKTFHFEGKPREELEVRRQEIQRQLRENQNQASEVRANINHTRIQLHRYQLKLEMLHERQTELKAELDALLAARDRPAA